MPFDGSGTYAPAGADFPAVTLTTISSTKFNNVITDMSTALSLCVTRSGQSPWTGNLPAGGFKITGMGAGTLRTDSSRIGEIQDGTYNWVVAGGTVDAITAAFSPAITTLVDGQICCFRASGANTITTPSFSPNGLTARTITRQGGTALQVGDISGALFEVLLRYNLANTRWEMLNTSGVKASATLVTPTITTPVISTPAITGGTMTQVPVNQLSKSVAYTTVLADGGTHILHPTADNNARTFTIDSNANVAYPIGTCITFVNQINTVTIAITADTMTLAGAGTTGSRTLAAAGIATAIKIAATSWMISGTGIT